MSRIGLAFRCFFRVLGGKTVPVEALPKEEPRALAPKPDDTRTRHALQLISILQKEGRLLDFLQEEIESYDDQQVGAAVRAIHRDCHKLLGEHLALEPVLTGGEDTPVTIEPGFDPSCVRLLGNVTGEPPFEGTLRHHGWRATNVNLPDATGSGDAGVVAPAEVELR